MIYGDEGGGKGENSGESKATMYTNVINKYVKVCILFVCCLSRRYCDRLDP